MSSIAEIESTIELVGKYMATLSPATVTSDEMKLPAFIKWLRTELNALKQEPEYIDHLPYDVQPGKQYIVDPKLVNQGAIAPPESNEEQI